MDCAYRFWTVTLSFCKGYETLQYASWAQDYVPVRSILPVAHVLVYEFISKGNRSRVDQYQMGSSCSSFVKFMSEGNGLSFMGSW